MQWIEKDIKDLPQKDDWYTLVADGAVPIIRWYDSENGWDIPEAEYGYKHYLCSAPLLQEAAAIKALRNLCHLKKWKDEHGKDSHYEQFQPEAWSYAFGVLEDIDAPPTKNT